MQSPSPRRDGDNNCSEMEVVTSIDLPSERDEQSAKRDGHQMTHGTTQNESTGIRTTEDATNDMTFESERRESHAKPPRDFLIRRAMMGVTKGVSVTMTKLLSPKNPPVSDGILLASQASFEDGNISLDDLHSPVSSPIPWLSRRARADNVGDGLVDDIAISPVASLDSSRRPRVIPDGWPASVRSLVPPRGRKSVSPQDTNECVQAGEQSPVSISVPADAALQGKWATSKLRKMKRAFRLTVRGEEEA